MATRAWDETDPDGAVVDAADIDKEIREAKIDKRQRNVQGGHKMSNVTHDAANEEHDGKHCIGVEDQTDHDDQGFFTWIWDWAGTTMLGRVYGSGHATKALRTEMPGDAQLGDGTDQLIGIAQAAFVRISVSDAVPVLGYNRRIVYKVPAGSPDRTLKRVGIVVGTRPTAASLTVDVRQVDTPADDSLDKYADGNTTSLGTVSLTNASSDYAVEDAGFTDTLSAGDELVLKWTAVNSAEDATVLLQVE